MGRDRFLDWFPWYPLAFWGSRRVLRLSEAACNLYRWMLDYQWVHGSVPDDPLLVRRLYPWGEAAADSWTAVRPLFDLVDGELVNARLAEVRREACGVFERKSAGGVRSAEARRARYGTAQPKSPPKSVRKSPPNDLEHRTGQDKTRQDRTEQEKRAQRAPAPPAWTEALAEIVSVRDAYDWGEACHDWAQARADHGHKTLKPAGWRRMLAEWHPKGLAAFRAAIAHSGSQGYQGLFAEKAAANGKHIPPGSVTVRDMLAGRTGENPKPRDVRAEVVREQP